jgi:hypothetical protein
MAIVMWSFAAALSPPPPDRVAVPELGPGRADVRYEAGQAVEIWQKDRWRPGKVQAVGDGRYFVFYDGFSVSWNEWVGPTRLRHVAAGGSAR